MLSPLQMTWFHQICIKCHTYQYLYLPQMVSLDVQWVTPGAKICGTNMKKWAFSHAYLMIWWHMVWALYTTCQLVVRARNNEHLDHVIWSIWDWGLGCLTRLHPICGTISTFQCFCWVMDHGLLCTWSPLRSLWGYVIPHWHWKNCPHRYGDLWNWHGHKWGKVSWNVPLNCSPQVFVDLPRYCSSQSNLPHLYLYITPLFSVMLSLSLETTRRVLIMLPPLK